MRDQAIIITIDVQGNVTTETKGYRGKACMKADQFLREGFGHILDEKKTAEFYRHEVSTEVIQNYN